MLSYMAADLGGTALTSPSWIPVCNTLAVASVAPFSGYLTDIFGRRNITLIGSILIMVGIVVVGTAHHFGQAIAGMSIAGAGAGIGELTALGWYASTEVFGKTQAKKTVLPSLCLSSTVDFILEALFRS
jgi:MFS family permease